MYISESTYDVLNKMLQKCFQANSFCDNLAYNISNLNMVNVEPIFHEKFAHLFPKFADTISDVMTKLDARAIRLPLDSNVTEYDNFKTIFEDLKTYIDQYRLDIINVIESAEINGDIEVKVVMENFLNDFMPYLHQVNIWKRKSEEYNRIEKFDYDFHSFTFI